MTIGSLGEDGVVEDELFYLSEEIAQQFGEYRVRLGDIVFSRVADVGRCLLITSDLVDHIISSNLIRIRVAPSKVLPEYILLTLKYSRFVRNQVARLTTQAAGRLLINTQTLSNLVFPIPPVEAQAEVIKLAAGVKATAAAIASRKQEGFSSYEMIRDNLLDQGVVHV